MDPLVGLLPANWPHLALVAARVMGMFIAAPLFGVRAVPMQLRATLAAALALFMAPVAPSAFPITSAAQLPIMVATEMMLGLVIGLSAALFFAGVELAGDLISAQTALGSATALDPTSGHHTPVVGQIMSGVAMVTYLLLGGHLILLRGVFASFEAIPPGSAVDLQAGVWEFVLLGATLFEIGLRVAAPVVAAMLLSQVFMGVLARAAPQMNVFMLSFPIGIALALFVLGATMPVFHSFVRIWVDALPDLMTEAWGHFQHDGS